MRRVEVSTQAELDALAPDEIAIVRSGWFVARESSHVEARGSSHVEARGSSHVVAWESSHVVAWESSHVVAWGSSHVVAWGSSHVEARSSSLVEARGSSLVEARDNSRVVARDSSHVEAWGSSHVEAWGSSHVVARDSSHVEASKFVATHRLSTSADVQGGVIIDVQIDTPQDWCDFHGIEVDDGKAVLFKAVDDDWKGGHKVARLTYRPGRTAVCPDWDPGEWCGNGLHLSPHPKMARSYYPSASRFVACEVDVESMVLLGDKVKVPRCKALHEVTVDGKAVS